MTTATYAVYTGVGKEKKTAVNLMKAARKCKEIIRAIPMPFTGYVKVEVVAGDDAQIKKTRLDMPRNTRLVIELVPGVIKVLGNGNEAVPVE